MKWRKYTPADYETIEPWFVEHGWPKAPHYSILSDTGIIVEDDNEKPIAVGFIYLSNSSMGFLEWLATDPKLGRQGLKALEFLIGVAKEKAAELEITNLWHLCRPKYRKVFEKKFGFLYAEEVSVMLWKGEN